MKVSSKARKGMLQPKQAVAIAAFLAALCILAGLAHLGHRDSQAAQLQARSSAVRPMRPVTAAVATCRSTPHLPRVIVQLGPRDVVPVALHDATRELMAANPCYEHRYFSYTSARHFIREYYLLPLASAFDTLRNYDMRLAFFCAVYLNINGGLCLPLGARGVVPDELLLGSAVAAVPVGAESRNSHLIVARAHEPALFRCNALFHGVELSNASRSHRTSLWNTSCIADVGRLAAAPARARRETSPAGGAQNSVATLRADAATAVIDQLHSADVGRIFSDGDALHTISVTIEGALADAAVDHSTHAPGVADALLLAVPRVTLNSTAPPTITAESIPHVVVQMGESEVVPQRAYHALMALRAANPEYTFAYFTEATARDWLHVDGGAEWARIFDQLRGFTERRLFFSLAFLVSRGGVAIDAEIIVKGAPLRMLLPPHTTAETARDSRGNAAWCFIAGRAGDTGLRVQLERLANKTRQGEPSGLSADWAPHPESECAMYTVAGLPPVIGTRRCDHGA